MKDGSTALETSSPDRGSTIHIGRYALHRQIARGGMATIHIARLLGDEGFSRIVAAKRLLPEFAEDPEFVAMFLDEARIASRVHHRNVVPVLDVVTTGDEVVLVQEYVRGVPLHWLLNRALQTKTPVPIDIAISIACQVLAGLHATHETTDELSKPLGVVHRDVSPQNVMIATDGTARLLDFGVAKSLMAAHVTREGTYKGKLAYSAPEQLRGAAVRQSDIYSLTVLLWELLVGHRMHRTAQAEAELVATIMNGQLPAITDSIAAQRDREPITEDQWKQLQALEPIIKRGLAIEPEARFQTATEMEEVLHALVRPASSAAVAQWLRSLGREYVEKHDQVLAAEEVSWRRTVRSQVSSRREHLPAVPMRPGAPPPVPSAPQHRAPYALVALLSLLVVALAVGIILVVVRTPTEPAAVDPAAAGPAVAPPPAAKPAEPPAAAAERERAKPAGEPALSIGKVETSPSAAPRAPSVRAPAAPRTGGRSSAPRPQPRATAPPAEATSPAKDRCNPPYYFEGAKKISNPLACRRAQGALMIATTLRCVSLAALAIGWLIASPPASADPSKEACVDAHSRGQDAREQGKVSLARKLFLSCAQPSCPALVQGDCARFADDSTRLQPTLSFVARDGNGHDLPDTAVYVDDVLVATRLDDGKAYDVDPGKHTVKFSHHDKEQVVTVVVGAGEKARTVGATFGPPPAGPPPAATATAPATPRDRGPSPAPAPRPRPVRPDGAKALLGVGAALALGGGALGVVGLLRVPGNCSIWTHQCAAPPGDPSFDEAGGAVTLANLGFVSAGVGVAALVGGLVWYRKRAPAPRERNLVAPWLAPGAAGIAVSGRL